MPTFMSVLVELVRGILNGVVTISRRQPFKPEVLLKCNCLATIILIHCLDVSGHLSRHVLCPSV